MTLTARSLEFELPACSIARAPAEHRGSGRDDVRLMVAPRESGSIAHRPFAHLAVWLRPGDVVVVNNSATLPASVPARASDGTRLRVHFASPGSGGLWTAEVRSAVEGGGTAPGPDLAPQILRLPDNTRLHLLARNPHTPRLWVVEVEGVHDLTEYLSRHGDPIRYEAGEKWPISAYQTVFATVPGSAEMPSAARPFTTEMVTRLVSAGVAVMPVTLHAGVSSYEVDESPGEERYMVPASTATVVNSLRRNGGRVIAAGTTVVRALETVADDRGEVHPGQGVTDLVIGANRGVRGVDGLLTGWHEPRSSHLKLLEAFTSREVLERVYMEALDTGYLWHEFGDVLLLLP